MFFDGPPDTFKVHRAAILPVELRRIQVPHSTDLEALGNLEEQINVGIVAEFRIETAGGHKCIPACQNKAVDIGLAAGQRGVEVWL